MISMPHHMFAYLKINVHRHSMRHQQQRIHSSIGLLLHVTYSDSDYIIVNCTIAMGKVRGGVRITIVHDLI